MIDEYRRDIADLLYFGIYSVLPPALWFAGDAVAPSPTIRLVLLAVLAGYAVVITVEIKTIDIYRPWLKRQCRRLLGVETVEPPDPHDIEAEAEVTEQ